MNTEKLRESDKKFLARVGRYLGITMMDPETLENDLMYAVERLAAIIAEEEAREPVAWIAVTDKFPDMPYLDISRCVGPTGEIPPMNYSDDVLVLLRPNNRIRVDTAFQLLGMERPTFSTYDLRVTHWMPIPQPPSAGGEK